MKTQQQQQQPLPLKRKKQLWSPLEEIYPVLQQLLDKMAQRPSFFTYLQ
jgi:hypothetical protein